MHEVVGITSKPTVGLRDEDSGPPGRDLRRVGDRLPRHRTDTPHNGSRPFLLLDEARSRHLSAIFGNQHARALTSMARSHLADS